MLSSVWMITFSLIFGVIFYLNVNVIVWMTTFFFSWKHRPLEPIVLYWLSVPSRLTSLLWPVPKSSHGCSVLAVLSLLCCSGYPVLPFLLRPSCPRWPFQVDLSDWPVQTELSRLSCLSFPVMAILIRLSCFSCPVPAVLSCHVPALLTHLQSCRLPCPVPDALFQLSCPCCHVLAILSPARPTCPLLSYPVYPASAVLSWLLLVLSWLSCPGCLVSAVLSLMSCSGHPLLSFLSRLTCSDWPVPAVLPILYRPCFKTPPVLFWLSYQYCSVQVSCLRCPVLAVIFWPSPPLCPTKLTFSGWPLTCPGHPALAIQSKMCYAPAVFPWLSCHRCSFPLSCPPAVLSCHVLAVLLSLLP